MNDDLISRKKLKLHYYWWRQTENGRKMADLFDEIVDAQPPAEVPDRKVGKWVKNEGRRGWHCSECMADNFYAYSWNCDEGKHDFQDHYCPNCGAKMEDTP